ncbi:hypothetical protein ABEB36_012050 [Hypothenemus hampei]|uniref:PDZ domain-containing protein n=1 Tax=Hypothenemus hampei TaxID=57062 RepID=A0ABD1E9Z6_HYPHA
MAIELSFSKPEVGSHWGFRLVGGADYNEPLVVVKVNENGLAEGAGLMIGDVVVRINDTPTTGLTHQEAHDLINRAGCEFVLAIKRGLFSDLPPLIGEYDDNAEVESILFKENHVETKDQNVGQQPTILQNLAGSERLENTNSKVSIQRANKSTKWSTFLVKPKNPKPVSKKLNEERQIIGEPYKVKIIKQPKRDPNVVLNRKKSVQFDQQVIEVEISRDTSIADSIDSLENSVDLDMEQPIEEQSPEEEEPLETEDTIEKPPEEPIKPILKPPPLDVHIDPGACEASLSLEEQLAAVQKQLLALSQLPSAIQVTLEAVTQQLNKIVFEKTQQVNGLEETIEEEPEDEEVIPEENGSLSENAEGDITDNDNEVEELENDEGDGEVKVPNGEPETEIVLEAELELIEENPSIELTEEEKEAKLREEEFQQKKQKIEEERRRMDWTQRPIVLPGGRKWSDPEDVSKMSRTKKMSDEKICKAIEDHSEVIIGKTKGINFLKFEPPPKNLDYLQKSEVYRLIHDMEPPVRGVCARAEKVLSEKDYYGDKGAP